MQKEKAQLRKQVEKVFGQRIIDKYSSQQLSDRILETTKQSLGYQTIRRFWGLAKCNDISIQSKNILCRYIGFNDWGDFLNALENDIINDPAFNWSLIKPFYFPDKKVEKLDDAHYWYEKMGRSFASFILTNEAVFKQFSSEMHRSEIAMKYVISFHPMYDNLGKDWYFRGLRLFLRHINVSHYKVFGNAVEGMRCVLTGKIKDLKRYLSIIDNVLPEMRKEYGVIWPLEARVLGLKMIYAKFQNDDNAISELKKNAFDMLKQHKNKCFEIDNYEIFVFILCDFLNIFRMADIAYELQQQYPLQFTQNVAWKDGYSTAAIIVRAMTLFMNDKKEKAKSLLDDIDLDMLNFDFKQYFSIQYYLLKKGLSINFKQGEKYRKLICILIETSKINFFETIIQRFTYLSCSKS